MAGERTDARQAFVRHRGTLVRLVVGLLVAVVAIESFLLYQERAANRASRTQSEKLLTQFLQGDTIETSAAGGVPIRLENVRFQWSDKVYLDIGNMGTRAVPIRGTVVDFDDLNSFVLRIQQSEVTIPPSVMEGMFNESVFNYPDSKMRDLKVGVEENEGHYALHLAGKVKMAVWLPFTMVADLGVDTGTNTLVMDVDHLKVVGVPATKLLRLKPFHLENVMSLPPNQSLMVAHNRILVKPFALFPPPRVNGRMARVTVEKDVIRLSFAGAPIPAPHSSAKNYVYLRGGTSQFGHFRMLDTDVLITDMDESDRFRFSLAHYAQMIPRSQIEIADTKAVRVRMPDASPPSVAR